MLGIVLVTFNRPDYLKQCLKSLGNTQVHIEDAGSTDKETLRILSNYQYYSDGRRTISQCLLHGFDKLVSDGYTNLMNLDSDAIVRNDWIERITELDAAIVTGFNCLTRNADGTERHKIISEGNGWNLKKSIGGINMYFNVATYDKYIRPTLVKTLKGGNWDHQACIAIGGAICTVPSVVQHIGIDSTLGHERPDVADDFKPLALHDVTLIGVDSNASRLQTAFDHCTKDIHFGAVKLLNEQIGSKERYSDYVIKHLYKHIETSHCLIVQWDGYVRNWKAWDDTWLQYDYIGATWWYQDGMNVGNGGFSLRSKRLMQIVAQDPVFHKETHPEDDVICRKRRRYLEAQYDIKFAPDEVAKRFSIEGYKQLDKTYTDQFGFHGFHVKDEVKQTTNTAVMLQYFGIGDVIFSMQIARKLIKDGYRVIWPVNADFVEGLQLAYPDIVFMPKDSVNVDYNCKADKVVNGLRLIPIRWTYEILNVPFRDCMKSKYTFMQMDWQIWRKAKPIRNKEREQKLAEIVGAFGNYTLVNRYFRSNSNGRANIQAQGIEMRNVPGYSLFDWMGIIENATEIHTVSTSIIYLMELLDLKCKPKIYIRRPDEKDHENYRYIMTKNEYEFE